MRAGYHSKLARRPVTQSTTRASPHLAKVIVNTIVHTLCVLDSHHASWNFVAWRRKSRKMAQATPSPAREIGQKIPQRLATRGERPTAFAPSRASHQSHHLFDAVVLQVFVHHVYLSLLFVSSSSSRCAYALFTDSECHGLLAHVLLAHASSAVVTQYTFLLHDNVTSD